MKITLTTLMLLLLSPSFCSTQQYTVLDLGDLGASPYPRRADAINSSGQVTGYAPILFNTAQHAFRTEANSPINATTDDLGTLGGTISSGLGINDSGQVTGISYLAGNAIFHAFRTAANSPINPATDDLGTLGGTRSQAYGIDASGRVVGWSETASGDVHAFRTAPNSPINPATDDLGPGQANGINASGQVVGSGPTTTPPYDGHAFRTAPNSPINPATDDLGALGGSQSVAYGINSAGQVVGAAVVPSAGPHAFLYSGGVMYDLNNLIPAKWRGLLREATAINDAGQIVATGRVSTSAGGSEYKLFLLTPNIPYKAFVQPPISADGRSIFNSSRGVIPVKFTLTKNDSSTCELPSATISVTRTAGKDIGSLGNGTYSMPANVNADFRISDCQYVYNLAARNLGAGAYRVDILIGAIIVGSAEFELE